MGRFLKGSGFISLEQEKHMDKIKTQPKKK
jgi:hypothetical protein